MTTSLDVSRKLDQISVDLLLAVDSTAVALGVTYCIIGVFARDVMLGLCYGIDTGEATRDVDFGRKQGRSAGPGIAAECKCPS